MVFSINTTIIFFVFYLPTGRPPSASSYTTIGDLNRRINDLKVAGSNPVATTTPPGGESGNLRRDSNSTVSTCYGWVRICLITWKDSRPIFENCIGFFFFQLMLKDYLPQFPKYSQLVRISHMIEDGIEFLNFLTRKLFPSVWFVWNSQLRHCK